MNLPINKEQQMLIEELSLNAWPALRTNVLDGWLLRFADGYTKRSNSVNPIYTKPELSNESIETRIDDCEAQYASVGMDVCYKITPFVPVELDLMLEKKGYTLVDVSSVRVLDTLDTSVPVGREQVRIVIEEQLSDEWLTNMAELNNVTTRNKGITKRMLSGSILKQGFFTLYEEDVPVACGLGVIERGYVGLYDIVTASGYRNRGLGELMIRHILHWARSQGAVHSYLQVVQNNEPAKRLYDKLGYQKVYTYWYRVKKRVVDSVNEQSNISNGR